jgi:hypothetical protein
MELRIGVVHTPKELSLELEGDPDEVVKAIEEAIGGRASQSMLWLTDVRGRRVGTPTDKIAYIEIDEQGSSRHVGFGR